MAGRILLWHMDPHNWLWALPAFLAGWFAYRLITAFLTVKPKRGWKALLFVGLSAVMSAVIWVGDNNLVFALPPFYLVGFLCSQGDRVGRLTVTTIFFCMILSVSALLDTYLGNLSLHNAVLEEFFYYDSLDRLLRPVIWGSFWLLLRKKLPEEPPRLSPRLWRRTALLAGMPLCSLIAVVVLTMNKYDSALLYDAAMKLGVAVLPFVLLTSLGLLVLLLTLEETRHLEQAQHLASLRESYYQGLQREQRQIRTLRHDLRNHFTVLQGLLEQGECRRAAEYLQEVVGSPALGSGLHLCENETANAVLAAKAEAMERAGVRGDFAVTLPPKLPLADSDLCALLGNALDNALEAAEQAKNKVVTVRCRAEKGLFMLRVENAVEGELLPDLATTKADKAVHGFGLAGMREIARRYGGSLETRAEGGRFELIACLPLDGGG